MSGSTVEPHDKMRARDVSKVARGEQAPRPPQRTPDVSRPPPPSSTPTPPPPPPPPKLEEGESIGKSKKEKMRHCYHTYYDYHRCIQENGGEAEACKKVADYYKSSCPEWIGEWEIK